MNPRVGAPRAHRTYPVHGAPARWHDSPAVPGGARRGTVLTTRGRYAVGTLIGVALVALLVACALIGDTMRCDRLAPTGVDHDERAFRYYCQGTP